MGHLRYLGIGGAALRLRVELSREYRLAVVHDALSETNEVR